MVVKTVAKEKEITIPQIKLGQMKITVKGETPLIMHRFGPRAIKTIEDAQQKVAKLAKEPRDPMAEFMDSLHSIDIPSERYGFPGTGVKKMLVLAGGRFADETMSRLRGIINIPVQLVEIVGSKPTMRTDPVRINGGLSWSVAYRPQFWPWEMTIPIVYNQTMMSDAQVINLIQIAGFSVGLGDWRPDKNGTFGTFSIKEVEG